MSSALSGSVVGASNPLLGSGTVPITCPLRHINSRRKRPACNKREIKGEFETRWKQQWLHWAFPVKSMQLVRGIMLCERTERERRDEGESTYNQYGADE